MTQVTYSPAAAKQLSKLPRGDAKKIAAKLDQLAAAPASMNAQIKALQGSDPKAYRLRIGDYRAIFVWRAAGLWVERIAHRKDVYR